MSPLHHRTPLLHSLALSERLGAEVWLKLESAQPTASFKARGMAAAAQAAVARGASRLVSSSGGNAGLAVAWAGRLLELPVTVVVPERTSPLMRARIAAEGAEVVVHGEAWDEAHRRALEVVEATGGALIHPFDDPAAWAGHASLVHEVAEQGPRPDAVVVAVGGGGLLVGVLDGLAAVGWGDTRVVAVETRGADSLACAVEARAPVTLPGITSIALTLGARRVCDRALELALAREVIPVRVSDRDAVAACGAFLDDHRVLVEPACGAALAAVYQRAPALAGARRVLVVVCGGASATREALAGWERAVLR